MTWESRSERIADGRGLRYVIEEDAVRLSYSQVLDAWRVNAEFRTLFTSLLADAPFTAFRWETPPLTRATLDRAFEFVLLDSPGLAGKSSPEAFVSHFDPAAMKRGVVTFANLGKDAVLVVPCPMGAAGAYGHLAAFVREAPGEQQHALWADVGNAMDRRLSTKPVWLSTAGAGVPWLHVRLDDRPKYYGHRPYCAVP